LVHRESSISAKQAIPTASTASQMHAHASAAKRLRSCRLLGRYRRAGGLSPRVAVCPALAIRSTVSVRPTKKAHRICRSFARPSAHWTWDQPHTRMGTPTPERKTAERKRERARRICPQVHGRDDSAANFKMQATLATRALANLRKAGTFRPESGRGRVPSNGPESLRAPDPEPALNGVPRNRRVARYSTPSAHNALDISLQSRWEQGPVRGPHRQVFVHGVNFRPLNNPGRSRGLCRLRKNSLEATD